MTPPGLLRPFPLARRLLSATALALALAACSNGPAPENAGTADTADPAGTIEESWSLLFEQANEELREAPSPMRDGDERCFEGDHGARLAVRFERADAAGLEPSAYVYSFGRDRCDVRDGEVRLRWPEALWAELLTGEAAMRRIPALHAVFLEQRRSSVSVAVDAFVDAAAALRKGGRYPEAYEPQAFEEHYFWADDARVDYRPGPDRRDFRVCIQHGTDGPWRAYDSAARGLVAAGDSGRCSFAPPPSGSLAEVRFDVERVHSAVSGSGQGCRRPPSDQKLVARGAMAEGNRLAACEGLADQEGLVQGWVVCVQHGQDGPWAVYHEWHGEAYGASGECDLDVPPPAEPGPWGSG